MALENPIQTSAGAGATAPAERLRVLVLAFHFPPSGGAGVQRTLKHVKYLSQEGIDATVIAARDAFPISDETLLADVPASANVVRTAVLPSPAAERSIPEMLSRAGLPPAPEADGLWPDLRSGWLIPAVSEGLRTIAAERPSVIYSTHPPATAHLAALILHRITGIPWVADFRDGWTLDPLFTSRGATDPESTAARNSLEATITAEATFVTVADDSLELRDLPPDAARRVTIANGVDPDDFRGRRPTSPPSQGRLRLSHVGTLHHLRNGDTVFTALRDALGSGRVDARAIDLRLVGWTTQPCAYRATCRSQPPATWAMRRRSMRCCRRPRCCSMRRPR